MERLTEKRIFDVKKYGFPRIRGRKNIAPTLKTIYVWENVLFLVLILMRIIRSYRFGQIYQLCGKSVCFRDT